MEASVQLPDAPIGHQCRQRAQGRRREPGIIGGRERLERTSAPFEVERRTSIDEDDVGARRPLERPPVGVRAARPAEGRAVGVGRIGGGQEVDPARRRTIAKLANRPQPVEGARQGELGGPQPVYEVAAPDPAGILECAQDRIDRREAASDALADDRLAGQDTVAVEEGQRQGMQPLGRRGGCAVGGQVDE